MPSESRGTKYEIMAMLLGKKVGMTQIYDDLGKLVPVTVIQAGPCVVMQVKTPETDGYNAVQLGFDEIKPVRRKNPQIGHAQKSNTTPKKFIREMRLADAAEQPYEVGNSVTVSVFAEDKFVDKDVCNVLHRNLDKNIEEIKKKIDCVPEIKIGVDLLLKKNGL